MRRIIGILAVVLALAVGNLTLASATTSGSASDDHGTKTLHLVSKTVDSADIDLGTEGFSLGDEFVFTDNLFQEGKRVGEDHGVCTVTRIRGHKTTVQCLVTAVLPKGQITVQGAITFTDGPSTFTLAVTGGTGAYKTAHGQVRVHEISETVAELTVHLIV